MAAFFELPIVEKTKIRVQADGSWLVTMQIPKELVEEIEYAQALVSHAVASKELVDYLEYRTKRLIKQKTSVRKSKSENRKNGRDKSKDSEVHDSSVPHGSAESEIMVSEANRATDANAEATIRSDVKIDDELKPTEGPFSQRQRKILMQEQKPCRHVDPLTQKQCPNTWFLQADHKQSRWAGGQSKTENGQMLCAAHNQKKYRKEAGLSFTH